MCGSSETDGIRQKLNHATVADRWTSRDHDLNKRVGRRSALHQLEIMRPEPALFYFPFPVPGHDSPMDDEAIEREKISVYSCSLLT